MLAVTSGGVMFWSTIVLDTEVHPFDEVTVTVKVPAEVTDFVEDVPPPLHT